MAQEMDDEHLEIIRDFVAESRDILDKLDPNLMLLEKDMEAGRTSDEEIIHDIFRGIHSLKGAAGFLKLENIGKLTHHGESLLDLFRKGKAHIETHHLDLLYACGDLLKEMLDTVEETLEDQGRENELDQLVARLQASMPKKVKKVAKSSQVDEMGLDENDIAEIQSECMRLIKSVCDGVEQYNENGGDDDLFDEVARDMGAATGQLQIIGNTDLAVASRKAGELARQLKQRGSFSDKNLMGLLQRLLEALKTTFQGIIDGKDEDYGPTLPILMDELLRMESGHEISQESEILIGETLVKLGIITRDHLIAALDQQQRPLGEILLDMKALDQAQLEVALKIQDHKVKTVKKEATRDGSGSIRVGLEKLDLLGNLVGELVIAENMVTHHESVRSEAFESFKKAGQVLNRISREIQDLVMSLRMVPIQGTFQKISRVIRDISHQLGKKARIQLQGEDTEIDKNVVEKLSSPLVHIVRNALDHGLELPEVRAAAGKDEVGTIKMTASQEGGEIVIRISDDGRGMNKAKILSKAQEKGLIPSGFVPENDEEIFNMILLPGFSTASQVTEISGRGVGMDVVKKNIEALQGSISITSTEGRGSTFSLRIPLTLSIIEGMLIRVGRAVLTVPLLNIRQSLVVGNHVTARDLDGTVRIKIRDELIPIVPLYKYLGFQCDHERFDEGILIVVEYGNRACCLLADEIIGQRQTVIKRVSNFFGDVTGVSGFSILSNGDITMVLDVSQLV